MCRFLTPVTIALSACAFWIMAAFCPPSAAEEIQRVDLELVLAVDASSSVSEAEFKLQMHGLATAFRHDSVGQAILASGDLGIAVTLVQWADNRKQKISNHWRIIRTLEEAVAFGDEVDQTARIVEGGGTAIGGLIKYSLRQLNKNEYQGRRKVIDISGDGRTNQGIHPQRLKDAVVAEGVTVNGLAILNEDPAIGRYYKDFVISGTGAFVMSTTSYEDFAAAMVEKLVMEISGTPIAMIVSPQNSEPYVAEGS